MNNKKMIVIPPLSSFENTLGIQDKKLKEQYLSQTFCY